MSKLTAEIPLSKIEKIQLYINAGKNALAAIKAETGADYLINGGLFNPDWAACCHLRADGNVLASDPYTYYGYAWSYVADFAMRTVPAPTKKNYICCTTLVENGGIPAKVHYTSAQGGVRGRTAIGMKGDALCLYCSGDGTADARTPEALRDELASLGWTSAVMLDSGGSSQCDFIGQQITSDREVHNLILVYLKKENKLLKKVCLDPGHGIETAGKCSPDKTYYEHEFNLDMAKRIKASLERHSVETTLTRSGEKDVSLADRVAIANAIVNLDLFVSIHTNAAGNDGWYSAKGLTCYTSAAGDTAGRNIAANKMLARFKAAGITLRGSPLVHSGLYVLRNTVAPAVLVEHGFHTDKEEVELLKSSAYRDKLAVAECKGILDYLGIAWVDEASELDQAVDKLSAAGIISVPDYWKAGKYSAENVSALIIKFAERI